MLDETFEKVYTKFTLQSYRRLFELTQESGSSLSAMEAFSLEVINMLGKPTVGQFAAFMSISQSNAAYKVSSLVKKGYLEKEKSKTDRRESHLVISDKYYKYMDFLTAYRRSVVENVMRRFPPETIERADNMLGIIADELMAESDAGAK